MNVIEQFTRWMTDKIIKQKEQEALAAIRRTKK
jgi:hypothetical protein